MATLLKEDYGVGLKNQLADETPVLDLFEREDNAVWEGREHVEAVHVNRNRGVYASAEGGARPTAGNQQVENLRIPIRYIHGSISITTQLIKASKSNKGSFARGMQLEMDRLLDDLRMQRLYYIWHDGRGVRALAQGTPGTDTVMELDAPGGVAGADHGTRYLNVGDQIVAINPATGALRAGGTRRITAVNAAGTACTVSAAIDTAWADNDFIVHAYGADASVTIGNTEWQHPPMGFLGMIDNGTFVNTYFNLSRTAFPILQSVDINSVGGLSADILQRAADVTLQVGSAKIAYHLTHPDTRRAYLTIMENDRRYMGPALRNPDAGTVAFKGGYNSGLAFGEVPIMVDPHCPFGMWFGFDNRSATRFVMSDGEWADEDGAVLRAATAVDTWDATYRIYDNFALLRPNQSFRLRAISNTYVVAHIV
jgi:hypothetical protein